MTDFILELTFDELPTDKKHQDMIRKEIETRIDSREWFTKSISYNTDKIIFKPKLLIMKFFKDTWDDEKYSLSRIKKWFEKNVKKTLLGRNKYYLDTYKVLKYKIKAKQNLKMQKALKEYKENYEKGGKIRDDAIKKYNKKTKKHLQLGGSKKRSYKRTNRRSNRRSNRSNRRSNRKYKR
jgi:hypothetical protein